jgi:hypothetical protein
MTIRARKPRNRPGFVWEYREGCTCAACPWKGNCKGEIAPHWVERAKAEGEMIRNVR